MNYDLLTELWRDINIAWRKKLEPICKEQGVTYLDRLILDAVNKRPHLNKKELALQLNAIHQNLTRSLNRLTQQKLIQLAKSTQDMRVIEISLTPKGQRVNLKLNKAINSVWKASLQDIQNQQITTLTNVLKKQLSYLES